MLSQFLGYIKQRRETVGNSLHLTANQVNARPLVQPSDVIWDPRYNTPQGGNGPQLAPDPIRQGIFDGIGHIGKARIPKFVSAYDQTAWENQSFIGGHLAYYNGGSIPFGNMLPEYARANISVPDNVAYGSQFEYNALPYGYV